MFKKVWNIFTTILMLLVVALACVFFVPRVFKLTPMAVLSGSMEPTYHVGSLVFVKEANPETIQVGDPITFHLAGAKTVVTHRVIGIDKEKKAFETQGDANATADGSPVAFSNVKGKALDFSIPFLGYMAVFMSSTQGIVAFICALAIIMLLSYLPSIFEKTEKKKKA